MQFHGQGEKDSLHHRHHQEQRDHQQQLVADIKEHIPGRDKIGDGQHGAGVIMGGEDDLRRVRVARDHVFCGEALFHLGRAARGLQLPAEPGTESLLLLFGFPDLESLHNFHRLRQHCYVSSDRPNK